MLRIILLSCLFAVIFSHNHPDLNINKVISPNTDSYKQHIKDDLKDIMDTKSFSEKEYLLSYFSLHDLDKDGLLNGLEIGHSFHHTHHLMKFNDNLQSILTGYEESIINEVDNIMRFDLNNDGFLNFYEYENSINALTNKGIPHV
ncbi:unnamed protein product [Gordionus sp. m RMFG-2023]|uniref:multiple coagulation factor deficiency protein 2 homolog n=1 Tax=Gordionus sp. m RMFG-2023 TaxID=3053472 RepID=UPI0030E2F030